MIPPAKSELKINWNYKTLWVQLQENVEYKGKNVTMLEFDWQGIWTYRKLVRFMLWLENGNTSSIAFASDLEFIDWTIGFDMLSTVSKNGIPGARWFAGIAFRASNDFWEYESFYLRPSNGRIDNPIKKGHATQYISYPKYEFDTFRKIAPEKYESSADIWLDEWTHIKIKVDWKNAKFYVNSILVLEVDDLKLGADKKGLVWFWIWIWTKAYFANLKVTAQEIEKVVF